MNQGKLMNKLSVDRDVTERRISFSKKSPATLLDFYKLQGDVFELRHNFDSRSMKKSIKELVRLKEIGGLSEDDFAEVLGVFLAKYVENEVNYRVEEVLSSYLRIIARNALKYSRI